MATTILMVSGKFLSLKNDGTPNAAGKVYLYEAGTSTPKTTYLDADLSVANAHPVILDAAGRAAIYFSGNGDITVKDASDVTLYTQADVNPTQVALSDLITTPTTLDSTHNGKWITTTADLTLPTALSAGSGWLVNIKNLASTSISVNRTGSGDTLNGALSSLVLPSGTSVVVITNDDLSGFDIFFSALLEIGTGTAGQALIYEADGPEWQSVDLINAGSDLYLYSNFT